MRTLAVVLAAALGGLAGAAAMHSLFGTSSHDLDPRAREIAVLHRELRELRKRIDDLEAREASAKPAIDGDGGIPGATIEEMLEAARTAAREAAAEVAQLDSADSDGALERESALARAVDQVHAPHEDTRRNGIRRLRRMFASEASAEVIPALADESAAVRMEAATYFEYLWDPGALAPLVDLLYGEDEAIAEQALDALCKSGQDEAIAKLEEYYLTGPGLELAFEAGKALEENRRVASVPGGVQRFRDALSSTDPADRRLGLAGVGRWGDAATDEWRVRALAADSDERVRAEAQRTLAAWSVESAK